MDEFTASEINKISDKLFRNFFADLSNPKDDVLFFSWCEAVHEHHMEKNAVYKIFSEQSGAAKPTSLEQFPFMPVSVFKDALLSSVSDELVYREINSSSSTSGRPSRMALDKQTSRRQSKSFAKIMLDRLGGVRRDFVVIDLPEMLNASAVVSARSSTIKSFLSLSSGQNTAVLECETLGTVNWSAFEKAITAAQKNNRPVAIFGFTYALYKYLISPLKDRGEIYDLPAGSCILHIGGWKRLQNESVSKDLLEVEAAQVFGIGSSHVIDIYGFTEQSGLLYPTCTNGLRHCPPWAHLIVRDEDTLSPCQIGQEGLMQFITPIQTSYPGWSVLTDDIGRAYPQEECGCGHGGLSFEFVGRRESAEARGCSDVS